MPAARSPPSPSGRPGDRQRLRRFRPRPSVRRGVRTASQREVDAVARAAALEPPPPSSCPPSSRRSRPCAAVPAVGVRLLAEPVDPAVDAERLVFRRAYAELIAGYVAAGVASGELPPQDPELTATALVGALAEAMVGPLAAGVAGPETIPGLITFIHRALGVSP
jgi:hypothetical protein